MSDTHQDKLAEQSTTTQGPASPSPMPPAEPEKRRSKVLPILAALFVLAAIGGAYYFYTSSGYEETDDAQVDSHITAVSARVGGTVLDVLAKDNQPVEAGAVLARIDPRDYQVALAQAEATLAEAVAGALAARTNIPITSTNTASALRNARAGVEEARAALQVASTQIESANARVQAAEARVQEAQTNYDQANRDLQRYRQLLEKDEIARQQYDQQAALADARRATLESTRAQLAEARQGVAAAQSSQVQTQARITQAETAVSTAGTGPQQIAVERARNGSANARVKLAQTAVDQARLNLEYTTVKAPMRGTVGRKSVEPGQVIAPNQQLMSVISLEDVWITANFKETQLAKMRVGQKVEIEADTFGGKVFHGRIDSFAPATGSRFSLLPPENATGNYVKVVQRVPVKIVLEQGEDSQHMLRPGMSVVPKVSIK